VFVVIASVKLTAARHVLVVRRIAVFALVRFVIRVIVMACAALVRSISAMVIPVIVIILVIVVVTGYVRLVRVFQAALLIAVQQVLMLCLSRLLVAALL